MILLGIVAGLLSALVQSGSYVFSRRFQTVSGSAADLVVYSQLSMGVLAGLTLLFVPLANTFADPGSFAGATAVWMVSMVISQYAFFHALKEIVASKLASLLGLKILVLAGMSLVFFPGHISGLQGIGVLLSAGAAVAMNWSGGGRLSGKGCAWLLITLFFYSLADLAETQLVLMVRSGSMILDGFIIGGVCYFLMGIATLPVLLFRKFEWRKFRDAFAFGAAWYSSMAVLFVCFGTIGTVFGCVVQSSRGLFSILLGVLLSALGATSVETKVSCRAWARRGAAALLMTSAIVLYALGKA